MEKKTVKKKKVSKVEVKEEVEKKEVEEKKEEKVFSVEDKKKEILESKLPESQKEEYLRYIEKKEKEKKIGVPFSVYAKIRKIDKGLQRAMLVYPKCRGIEVATLKQWDEILKDF